MGRFTEAAKNPSFRNAILGGLAIVLLGVGAGAYVGAAVQETLVGGWEYGALIGALGIGVLAAVPAFILYIVIQNVGRH